VHKVFVREGKLARRHALFPPPAARIAAMDKQEWLEAFLQNHQIER
jgi:hypothetical protein